MLDLVDVARAHAATIDFLQGHQIEVADQRTDLLQVAGPTGVRQQVLPTAGQVMAVALGTDTNLDIETEQAQTTIFREAGCLQVMLVDLRLMQANASGGSHASHGFAAYLAARSLAIS